MKSIKKIALTMLLLGTMIPAATFAQSSGELQAQIQALLAQVKALQQQLADQGGTSPAAWCHTFDKNLRYGDSGDEVSSLQQALGREGFTVAMTEISGLFGDTTAASVTGFQQKYASEILTPAGLQYGTGFVGAGTRAKLNKIYGCGGGIVPPGPQSITVVSPNGGESWAIGTMQTIRWSDVVSTPTCPPGVSCAVLAAQTYDIKLNSYRAPCTGSICPMYPDLAPITIAQGVNGPSYDWSVGSLSGKGTVYPGSYAVQVCNSITGVCDSSNAQFTITSGVTGTSSITVLSPNGGEVVNRGTSATSGDFLSYKASFSSQKTGNVCEYITQSNSIADWKNAKNYRIGCAYGYNPGAGTGNVDAGSTQINNAYDAGNYYLLSTWQSTDSSEYSYDFSNAPFTITSGGASGAPTISGVSGPSSLTVGQQGNWTVSASDSKYKKYKTLWYSVKWGDEPTPVCITGQTCAMPAYAVQQTATFTHTYGTAGIYFPIFTVSNAGGGSAQTSLSVNVGGGTSSAPSMTLGGGAPVGAALPAGGNLFLLDQLKLTNTSSEDIKISGISSLTVNPTDVLLTNAVYNLKIYDGANVVGTVTTFGADSHSASSLFSSPVVVPAGAGKLLQIYGDVQTISSTGTFTLVVQGGDVTAKGVSSGNAAVTSGFAIAGPFSIVPSVSSGPQINSVSPQQAAVDASVTLAGAGFTPTDNNVNFGGRPLTGLTSSNGTITFAVPDSVGPACAYAAVGARCMIATVLLQPGTYPVYVTNSNGTSNTVNFTVVSSVTTSTAPIITSLSPSSGPAGSLVYINGSNLSATGGATVNIATYHINYSSYPTQAWFNLPAGIAPGTYPVSITNGGGTSNAINFTVTMPVVSTPLLQGTFDAINTNGNGLIQGWAWDKNNPTAQLTVSFYADGGNSPIGTVVAQDGRADLTAAGITGNHAFNYAIPAVLKDGKTHSVSTYVSSAGGSSGAVVTWQLNASPRSYAASVAPLTTLSAATASGVTMTTGISDVAVVGAFTFSAGVNGDAFINSLNIQQVYSGGSASAASTVFRVYDGSTLVGSGSIANTAGASGNILLNLNSAVSGGVDLTKGSSKTLYVKADLLTAGFARTSPTAPMSYQTRLSNWSWNDGTSMNLAADGTLSSLPVPGSPSPIQAGTVSASTAQTANMLNSMQAMLQKMLETLK